MMRSLLFSAATLSLVLGVPGCGGGSKTVKPGGGDEAVPKVEYIGPPGTPGAPGAPVELLFTAPTRPSGDLGTIRVDCSVPANKGCSYGTASRAMTDKAREIGASGVHTITESSGAVTTPMETIASQNGRVYIMAGTAFQYSGQ